MSTDYANFCSECFYYKEHMMDKPIRFGVIGCSEEARRHLLPMPHRDMIQVMALCDADYKRRQSFADTLRPHNGGCGFIVAQTLEAALPDVDAVFIAHYHAEQISLALHEGKHVLVAVPSPLGVQQYEFLCECVTYARKHGLYFFASASPTDAFGDFVKMIHGELHPYVSLQRMILSAGE